MVCKRGMVWMLPALSVFLSSCSFNPFSTHNDLTGNATGPAIGAVAGGATGALFGLSKPGIGLAALGGAAIGYYFTTLTFDAGGVTFVGGEVFSKGDFVTIEIPTDRLFDTNTADLLPNAQPILNSALKVINRYPNTNVLISGNTSGFGTAKWEHKLSENRAKEVAAYFWSHGISSYQGDTLTTRKLIYVGYGDYFPIANRIRNDSLRSNSRIQITLYPCFEKLHLSGAEKIFANIGDNGKLPHFQGQHSPAWTADNAFKGDLLPEVPEAQPKDELSERASPETIATPTAGNYYKETSNAPGNDWTNYNNVPSAAQTTSGESSVKQGGFTGSSGYKEETGVNFPR